MTTPNKNIPYGYCHCGCGRKTKPAAQTSNSRGIKAGQPQLYINHHGNRKHSHSAEGLKSSTYRTWDSMIQRCTNPRHRNYRYYGGRGIRVCDRWKDFSLFFADMGERPLGLTIDRFPNVDGNYEPGNCRWVSRKEQSANTRLNRVWKGKRRTIRELAMEYGISYSTLKRRIYEYEMPLDQALFEPVGRVGVNRVYC